MKIEWEECDIVTGRVVTKDRDNEKWMIGYAPHVDGNAYTIVSLSDGMITFSPVRVNSLSKRELAAHLTKSGLIPIETFDPPRGFNALNGKKW